MLYVRGNPADYDGWAQLGCRGWSFDDVLPLFRRSTLVTLNPLVLAFPSAVRAAGAHTNLFVTEIGLAEGVLRTSQPVFVPASFQAMLEEALS